MLNFLDLKIKNFCLDINESSLKVVEIEMKKKSFSLLFSNELKINPGIIKDGIIQDQTLLTEAIKQVCKKAKGEKASANYAVVCLPEDESFLQVIQMPKMSEDELKMAVALEVENYIPLPMDQVYFDFQVIPPINDGLDHLDILIVAMSKKIIDSYVLCIKNAGIIPIAIEIESQSIARSLIKNKTSDSPVALIDFDSDKMDLIIFSGNSVRFTASVPFVFENLITEIEKYVGFYKEHASHEHIPGESAIKKIILCGKADNLQKIATLISEKTGIKSEVGEPFINFPKQINSRGQMEDPLNFTAALGLALKKITFIND